MKLPILLAVPTALFLAALAVRSARARAAASNITGAGVAYRHPIGLQHRTTREEAEARTAKGAAVLTGYFGGDGR